MHVAVAIMFVVLHHRPEGPNLCKSCSAWSAERCIIFCALQVSQLRAERDAKDALATRRITALEGEVTALRLATGLGAVGPTDAKHARTSAAPAVPGAPTGAHSALPRLALY